MPEPSKGFPTQPGTAEASAACSQELGGPLWRCPASLGVQKDTKRGYPLSYLAPEAP